MFQTHRDMGIRKIRARANRCCYELVLECTGFPPFARALQREVELPIFSWGTMLDYTYSVVVDCDYYGYV